MWCRCDGGATQQGASRFLPQEGSLREGVGGWQNGNQEGLEKISPLYLVWQTYSTPKDATALLITRPNIWDADAQKLPSKALLSNKFVQLRPLQLGLWLDRVTQPLQLSRCNLLWINSNSQCNMYPSKSANVLIHQKQIKKLAASA